MSLLSDKYGIPQNVVNRLINDGIISGYWPAYEEIYNQYLSIKSQRPSLSKHSIAEEIAAIRNCSSRHVEYVIDKFE